VCVCVRARASKVMWLWCNFLSARTHKLLKHVFAGKLMCQGCIHSTNLLTPSSSFCLPFFIQIAVTFKNQQVLSNCSWEVKKGERVGLVGTF
jgi:ABC-type polysaccharide/polyol phosphate transport system ATPase subunit